MSKRLSLAAACALLSLAAGCGTISNLNEGRHPAGGPPHARVFGGVRSDIDSLTETAWGEFPLGIVLLADLPLSFVGDVVTLPRTVRAARTRQAWPTEQRNRTSPQPLP